jgi:hypothetical protein
MPFCLVLKNPRTMRTELEGFASLQSTLLSHFHTD